MRRLVLFACDCQFHINNMVYKMTEVFWTGFWIIIFGLTSRYNSRLVYKWNLLTIQGGRRCCCILHLSHRVWPITHGGSGVVRSSQWEGSPIWCHSHLLLLTALQTGRFGIQVSLCGGGLEVVIIIIYMNVSFSLCFQRAVSCTWITNSETEAKSQKVQPGSTPSTGATAALCWSTTWLSLFSHLTLPLHLSYVKRNLFA